MSSTALDRLRALLPAIWAGALLTVAAVATPAAFAILPAADAGRVVARVLAQEAGISLALGVIVLLLERHAAGRAAVEHGGSRFSAGMLLALGTFFCTVLGYYALQPLMQAARAGQGAFSFAQLHAVSAASYVVKTGLVLALAWRAAAAASLPGPGRPAKPAKPVNPAASS